MPLTDHAPDTAAGLSPGALSILEVAADLFAENGYDAVSINDIARQAQVSKANIFHHFKSKESLYIAVLSAACKHSAQALDEVEQALAESDAPTKVEAFFAGHLQRLLADQRSTRLVQRELLEGGSERGRQLAERVFSAQFSRLVALIHSGQSQGQFRKDFDPALVAFLLIGANVFYVQSHPVLQHLPESGFGASADGYSAAVFALLSRGFQQRGEA